MLMGFVIVIHSLACIALIFIILIQSGRGGGLTEGFAGAESMFGAKTNETMVKITTGLTVVFLITSLALAFMSARAEKSLMETAGENPFEELPIAGETVTLDIPKNVTAPETKPVADAQPPVKVEEPPFNEDGTRSIQKSEAYTVKEEQPEQE
ncbi:MAG TPA: preprotein translocase subunit SecG [Candidatus Omnitrophota bacterium]|nr:preprotein translocase subunit SecG [Candidatus Omnitrophota bacterium]HSA31035.1 preprotein translocase subunit SecG [Candidatus Omnitrophota bacterium]